VERQKRPKRMPDVSVRSEMRLILTAGWQRGLKLGSSAWMTIARRRRLAPAALHRRMMARLSWCTSPPADCSGPATSRPMSRLRKRAVAIGDDQVL